MRMVFSGNSPFSERWPVSSSSTRCPTSRTSLARPARISFFSAASWSAKALKAARQAKAADLPLSMAEAARSSSSGSPRISW